MYYPCINQLRNDSCRPAELFSSAAWRLTDVQPVGLKPLCTKRTHSANPSQQANLHPKASDLPLEMESLDQAASESRPEAGIGSLPTPPRHNPGAAPPKPKRWAPRVRTGCTTCRYVIPKIWGNIRVKIKARHVRWDMLWSPV